MNLAPSPDATLPPPLRFTVDDAERAGNAWGFNCGPGALCALLSLTPDELLPYLGDFKRRGYMSPTHMWQALRALKTRHFKNTAQLDDRWQYPRFFPLFGLVRVQWGGPWCNDGVPIKVRYCHTHWVAAVQTDCLKVFDINATCAGGWLPFKEWSKQLVPWLIRETQPRADGTWWITHTAEVMCND